MCARKRSPRPIGLRVHLDDPLVPLDTNDGGQLLNQAVSDALLAGPTDNATLAHEVSAQQHPAAKRHYCQDERQPRETARAVRRDERREAPTGLAEG